MNVLQEIGLSYTRMENDNPELTLEDYWENSDYEGDYSYVVNEIIEWYGMLDNKYGDIKDKAWAKENNLKFIEGETGGESSGEYCYAIFSWKEKVYKIEFSYYSYHGNDFDGVEDTIREVKPVEKLVTVYE